MTAGVAAGTLFTPAPWRLITDSAILSENWPGIFFSSHGAPTEKFTNCALCTAGCAVKARCVNDRPISLAGVVKSPICALGLAGLHMPFHTARIAHGDAENAAAAVRAAQGKVAVLDLRPGRTASWTYRRAMAALPGGIYLAPQRILNAVNLAAVKTLVSFGAPVLDGWGTPSKVLAAREHFSLIQVEKDQSHTGLLADRWIPVQPGNEPVVAQQIARDLPADGSSLFLSSAELPSVLKMNVTLGNLGHTVIARNETPVPAAWSKQAAAVHAIQNVADRSIGALLIDEASADVAVPWDVIAPKLTNSAVVITFASTQAGYGRYAQFVLPAAVYPEVTTDIPTAIDSVVATFRLATPLMAAPSGVVDAAEFVASLAKLDTKDALQERAASIHATGRGSLLSYSDQKSRPIKDVKADQFWTALNAGACWSDSESPLKAPRWEATIATPAICEAVRPKPPLFTKLYEESGLKGIAS